VEIEIHDYADLSRNSLREFAISMHRILTSGNLLVHTVVSTAASASRCTRPHRTTGSLQIRILRDAPNRTEAQPILREAFVGAGRGRYATLFVHAVQQQASAVDVPWTVVLASAGSHEVGHLLLGGAHTPRGVMKAHWNRSDYESMKQSGFHFSIDQVHQFALINGTESAERHRISALTGFTAASSFRERSENWVN
jgi:hypothetical protein